MRSVVVRAGLFCAACHAAPTPVVSVAPPQAPLPQAAPPTPVPVADACAGVLAAQRDVLTLAAASDRRASPDDFKDVHDDAAVARGAMKDSGIACYAFSGGTWSLEIGDAHVDPRGPRAYGKLVAVLRIGATRAQAPEDLQIGYGEVSSRLAGDYDGDGVPELWVNVHTVGPEGGEDDDAKIWTVDAHGDVVRYAPSAGIDITGAPFDADGDGRLDLPTSDGLGLMGAESCDYSKDYGDRPRLLAHSLKGGSFSIDDDVAKAWARKTCPAAPTVIASTQDALCARLWAKTPADVKAARAKVTSCVQWDCSLKAQPRGAALDCDARRETFDQNVPFTLP